MTRLALGLVLALPLSITLSAHAETTAAEGLKAGTAAPQFKLPVVNEFTAAMKPGEAPKKASKWGPELWTGGTPAESKKLVIMSFFAEDAEGIWSELRARGLAPHSCIELASEQIIS